MNDVRFPTGTPRPRVVVYLAVPAAIVAVLAATLFPLSVVAGVATAVALPVLTARRAGGL